MKAHPVPEAAIEAVARRRTFRRDEKYGEIPPEPVELEVAREEARQDLEAANDPLREQHFKEAFELLLGEEMRRVAGQAAYLDFDPVGDFDLLEEPRRMSWEGNAMAAVRAAISKVSEGLGE